MQLRAAIDHDGLHDGNGDEAGELVTLTRAQESELARAVRITFLNANKAYNSGTVTAWVNFTGAQAISESQLAIVMDEDRAQSVAEYLLNDVWAARETGKFSLMPSSLALEPGDVVKVTTDRGSRDLRLTSVNDGEGRDCEASGSNRYRLSKLIRRSRSPDAESWDLYKVPLMEEIEADEVAIYQISQTVGRGGVLRVGVVRLIHAIHSNRSIFACRTTGERSFQSFLR